MSGALSVAGFVVVALVFAMYVVLDGYDLGVAAIAPFVARSDRERAAAMSAIGPYWNGNEVWLIVAAAALFALFPKAYAASFSGFYLPLIVVLWLLMFRGIALELRDHEPSELWHQFFDACFSVSSVLLIAVFGIALGNLLRGLPLDASSYFQGTFGFLLNPYALGVGLFAIAVLALHGAAFLALRIEGEMGRRSASAIGPLWWSVLVLYAGVTAATFAVRGAPSSGLAVAIGLLSLASLIGMRVLASKGRAHLAFFASALFVGTLPVEAATSIYPYLLPAYPLGSGGLSIYAAAPSSISLACAIAVVVLGGGAAFVYGGIVARKMAGKIRVE